MLSAKKSGQPRRTLLPRTPIFIVGGGVGFSHAVAPLCAGISSRTLVGVHPRKLQPYPYPWHRPRITHSIAWFDADCEGSFWEDFPLWGIVLHDVALPTELISTLMLLGDELMDDACSHVSFADWLCWSHRLFSTHFSYCVEHHVSFELSWWLAELIVQ